MVATTSGQMHIGEVGENPLGSMLEKRKSAPENTLTAMIEP